MNTMRSFLLVLSLYTPTVTGCGNPYPRLPPTYDPDDDGLRTPDLTAKTLPDGYDWCPYVAGPAENHGCPFAIEGKDCAPAGAFAWNKPDIYGATYTAFAYPFDFWCKPYNLAPFSAPHRIENGVPLDNKSGIWTKIASGSFAPDPVFIEVKSCQAGLSDMLTWSIQGGPDQQVSIAECLDVIGGQCSNVSGQRKTCLFWLPQDGISHRVSAPLNFQIRGFWPGMDKILQSLITLPDGSTIPTGSYQSPNCTYNGAMGGCWSDRIK